MTSTGLSPTVIRDLYARMLLTRTVDEHVRRLYEQGGIEIVASARGHEAAQVGSAVCIEVGKDFTLPYYRDLGVVLTIGMTPYEVFRSYLLAQRQEQQQVSHIPGSATDNHREQDPPMQHWGYHKHNMVNGPAPVATHILHAAGIAFASKLRKAPVVTVAYCGDGATAEPDFLEGMRFAALHRLPLICLCELERDPASTNLAASSPSSLLQNLSLPTGLTHHCLDGADVVSVYTTMRVAMQQAREGQGPILLEVQVARLHPALQRCTDEAERSLPALALAEQIDPLVRCQHYLQAHGAWDDEWATQLSTRIFAEVERALQSALHDLLQPQ